MLLPKAAKVAVEGHVDVCDDKVDEFVPKSAKTEIEDVFR